MTKFYVEPQFQLVGQDESNRVFFAASSPTPSQTSVGGKLTNVGGWS